eukprot:Opistho-2@29582
MPSVSGRFLLLSDGSVHFCPHGICSWCLLLLRFVVWVATDVFYVLRSDPATKRGSSALSPPHTLPVRPSHRRSFVFFHFGGKERERNQNGDVSAVEAFDA